MHLLTITNREEIIKTTIHRIPIGVLAVLLTISCQVSEVRATDTLRTLQPMQTAPTAKRTLATQPAQTAPTAPLVRTTSPTVQAVPARAVVSRAVPSRPTLTATGGSVTVTLSGSNLNLLTSAQALLDGTPVTTVTASLGLPAATSRQLTLMAQDGSPVGNYKVHLVAGIQSINLPAKVLSVAVNAPLVVHPSSPLPVKEKVLPLSPSLVKTGNARIGGDQDIMRPSGRKETGVAGKPSENDLNNAVRGSTLYPKQQRSASGLKLSQPSPLAPPAPSSPGQFGDRSGLQASILRTTRLRPPSADSGNTSGDGESGSGLKSASGAEGSSADQQAGEGGADSEGADKMPPEVPLESKPVDPGYARLIELGVVSESAAQSGLKPEEAAAFVERVMELGADDTLHSDNMWARVASEGTTEGVERETVAESFGLDETAAKVGLSPKDMMDVVARTQKYNNGESLLGDPEFWKEAGKTGPDGAEAMAIKGGFDLPAGVLPGAGPRDLLDGIADIQENDGDPSSQEDWNDYTREGSGPGTSSDDSDLNGNTSDGDGFSSSSPGADDGTNDSFPPDPVTTTPPGSESMPDQADEGSNGDQPWIGPEPGGDQSSEIGTADIQNSITNEDGSYSYSWDVEDSEGNDLGGGYTECSGGTCTDYNDNHVPIITYKDNRGKAPVNGDHYVVISNDNKGSTSDSNSGDESADDSTADAENDSADADTTAEEDSDPAPADTSSSASSGGDDSTEGTPNPEGESGGGMTWDELSDEEKQEICGGYKQRQQRIMGGMEGEFSVSGCASGPEGPGDFKAYLKARINPYILTDDDGDSEIYVPVIGEVWTRGDLVDTLPDPGEWSGGSGGTVIPGKDPDQAGGSAPRNQ